MDINGETDRLMADAFDKGMGELIERNKERVSYDTLKAENEKLNKDVDMFLHYCQQPADSPWVSVDDRLPEVNQQVLCMGQERYVSEVEDEDEGVTKFRWVHDLGEIVKEDYSLTLYAFDISAAYWMPIPEQAK